MSYTPPYTIPEILKYHSEGWTCSQIGKHFNRSAARMAQLIKQDKQHILSAAHSKSICSGILTINDLDKKLGIEDLLSIYTSWAKSCVIPALIVPPMFSPSTTFPPTP